MIFFRPLTQTIAMYIYKLLREIMALTHISLDHPAIVSGDVFSAQFHSGHQQAAFSSRVGSFSQYPCWRIKPTDIQTFGLSSQIWMVTNENEEIKPVCANWFQLVHYIYWLFPQASLVSLQACAVSKWRCTMATFLCFKRWCSPRMMRKPSKGRIMPSCCFDLVICQWFGDFPWVNIHRLRVILLEHLWRKYQAGSLPKTRWYR